MLSSMWQICKANLCGRKVTADLTAERSREMKRLTRLSKVIACSWDVWTLPLVYWVWQAGSWYMDFILVAVHNVLFREQALKTSVMLLALLSYATVLKSTFSCVGVSVLGRLTEDAASSSTRNWRVCLCARALSLACGLLLTASKAGTSSPADQI